MAGHDSKAHDNFLPKRIATAQGHLDQEFKNIRTTKVNTIELENDISPQQELCNIKTNEIMCTVISTTDICKSYYD